MSRELDAKVSEKVMGWSDVQKKLRGTIGYAPVPKYYREIEGQFVPHFTTDSSADYTVLERIRDKWDDMQHTKFVEAYEDIMISRAGASQNHALLYQPGDWSRAALKALGEET